MLHWHQWQPPAFAPGFPIESNLVALLGKLGGLGIPIFAEILLQEDEYSRMLSQDLSTRAMKQECQHPSEID